MEKKVKLNYDDRKHNFICPLCDKEITSCSDCKCPLDDTCDTYHVFHSKKHICSDCKKKFKSKNNNKKSRW